MTTCFAIPTYIEIDTVIVRNMPSAMDDNITYSKDGKRRRIDSKLSLIGQVLENMKIRSAPVAKAELHRQTGIDFGQLKRYCDLLTTLGFIRYASGQGGKGYYTITQAGRQFFAIIAPDSTNLGSRTTISLHDHLRYILTFRYDPFAPANNAGSTKRLYWQDFRESSKSISIEEMSLKVEQLLTLAIKRRLAQAKSIGIALGGGVDSAVILALIRKVFPTKKITAISVGFNGNIGETQIAAKMAQEQGAKFERVMIHNMLSDLPQQLAIIGEPRWNLWWYYVAYKASKLGLECLVTGDGGDELFGGYVFRYKKFLSLSACKTTSSWFDLAQNYVNCHDRDWVPDQHYLFGPKLAGQFSWEGMLQFLRPYFDNKLVNLNKVMLADFNGKLYCDWLPTNHKFHEHFGISPFSPFLTDDIIRYSLGIPLYAKYDAELDIGKVVLRDILRRYDVADVILGSKVGFGPDMTNYWKKYGRHLSQKYLDDPYVSKALWVNSEWINDTMDRLKNSNDSVRYINKMVHILSLEIWRRLFFEKNISARAKLE
jgi:asparagine synthase (glutamine-hydrolysing)